MSSRKLISSGSQFEDQAAYSRAVVDGDYVFVAGTTGYDYQTMDISEDVIEQTEQCFVNIVSALEQAGSSLDQVVRVHYILANVKDFDSVIHVVRKYFHNIKPAGTIFEAKLVDDCIKIEIEVTARLVCNKSVQPTADSAAD